MSIRKKLAVVTTAITAVVVTVLASPAAQALPGMTHD